MKILGIDPSLTCLGWGVVEQIGSKIEYIESGTIKTKSDELMHKRLNTISSQILQIIQLYKPNAIAMEETFLNKNPVSSMKLAFVRGAIMACVGQTNIPYYEYLPNKIKKTIVGVGHADKHQVKHMINTIISGNTENISFDEADAIATAYTCLVYAK